MDNLTAITIQSNEVICTCAGPYENGLFAGFITHDERKYCRPIVNTDPIYKSKRKATRAMKRLVKKVRRLDDSYTWKNRFLRFLKHIGCNRCPIGKE